VFLFEHINIYGRFIGAMPEACTQPTTSSLTSSGLQHISLKMINIGVFHLKTALKWWTNRRLDFATRRCALVHPSPVWLVEVDQYSSALPFVASKCRRFAQFFMHTGLPGLLFVIDWASTQCLLTLPNFDNLDQSTL
jgi:hypothetical protein